MPAGLTTQDILETVDTLVPLNNISDKMKIRWINQVQNQLFRDYPVLDAVVPYVALDGKQFYDLPADCAIDQIRQVTVNDVPYPYYERGTDMEPLPDQFVTLVSGLLFIQPKPRDGDVFFLYYGPRPTELSLDKPNAVSSFPADYHELLVYGCAMRVAEAMNSDKAGYFSSKYEAMAEKADRTLIKPRQRTVNVARVWR